MNKAYKAVVGSIGLIGFVGYMILAEQIGFVYSKIGIVSTVPPFLIGALTAFSWYARD